jgi:hypothetical protein
MESPAILQHLTLVLLLFPVIASAGAQPGNTGVSTKTVEIKGVSLTASVPQASVAGSTIELKIKVQNNSRETVGYRWYGKYVDYELKVVNSKGKAARLTEYGEIAYGPTRGSGSGLAGLQLDPEKHFEVKLHLTAVFDLTMPGDYTLSVRRKIRLSDTLLDLKIENLKFSVLHDTD